MIAIGFVLYKPEIDFVYRVKLLKDLGYRVYIFDNSPEETLGNNSLKILNDLNYYTCGTNLGLGVGITCICYKANLDNYESLLFFDQDTKFTSETLEFISSFYIQNQEEFDLYAALQFSNKFKDSFNSKNKFEIEKKKLLISSGCLFNLKNLKAINWHNISYFVDGVDYELCLRAHINGYLLGEISKTPGFDHITGQADTLYIIFGHKLYLRAYNPTRLKDIFLSYVRLLIMSVWNKKITYIFVFLKSILIFIFYQLIVRFLNFIKKI